MHRVVIHYKVPEYGGPQVSRQNILYRGKTFCLAAKLFVSRQNILSHGKTLFFHGKAFCLTANFFLMAKRSFVQYNILSEENTWSESERKEHITFAVRKTILP